MFGFLIYVLSFSAYISLHHNPKYTLWKVIAFSYRFLSSKVYQNKYWVIGLGVLRARSWAVDTGILCPGFQALGPWSWGFGSWGPGLRILGPESCVVILDCAIKIYKYLVKIGKKIMYHSQKDIWENIGKYGKI